MLNRNFSESLLSKKQSLFDEDLPGFKKEFLSKLSEIEEEKPRYTPIVPNPGFCVKFTTTEGDKVFVNICHHEIIPHPQEISEEDLLKKITSLEPIDVVVPISVGDAHYECDHAKNPCTVYDVAVNSTYYYERVMKSHLFKEFFLTIAIESLNQKYDIKKDPNTQCKEMTKIKQKGQILVHRVENRERIKAPSELIQESEQNHQNYAVPQPKSSPRIAALHTQKKSIELASSNDKKTNSKVVDEDKKLLIEEVKTPIYELFNNELLNFFINIWENTVKLNARIEADSVKDIKLTLKKSKIYVRVKNVTVLKCGLPVRVINEEVDYNYSKNNKMLYIKMHCETIPKQRRGQGDEKSLDLDYLTKWTHGDLSADRLLISLTEYNHGESIYREYNIFIKTDSREDFKVVFLESGHFCIFFKKHPIWQTQINHKIDRSQIKSYYDLEEGKLICCIPKIK